MTSEFREYIWPFHAILFILFLDSCSMKYKCEWTISNHLKDCIKYTSTHVFSCVWGMYVYSEYTFTGAILGIGSYAFSGAILGIGSHAFSWVNKCPSNHLIILLILGRRVGNCPCVVNVWINTELVWMSQPVTHICEKFVIVAGPYMNILRHYTTQSSSSVT